MEEELEIETETTFNTVDLGMMWAVFRAWMSRRKLSIKNAHTKIVIKNDL